MCGDLSGSGESVRGWALQPSMFPGLEGQAQLLQSCLVSAWVWPMLINGHKMPRRQQLPCSMKSNMIYGIEALREQLSELGEASEKWVSARQGLEGGHPGRLEGAQTLASLPHGPGGEIGSWRAGDMSKATQLRDSSMSAPVTLPLASRQRHTPGCLAHTFCSPVICRREASSSD